MLVIYCCHFHREDIPVAIDLLIVYKSISHNLNAFFLTGQREKKGNIESPWWNGR